jgi:hypothetical protein
MRRRLFIGSGLLLVLAMMPFAVHSEPKPAAMDGAKFFEKDVQPILQAQCISCHGGGEKKPKGGLALTSRAALLKGGASGPAVTLDQPDTSLLIKAINHQDLKMPPKGKLTQAQIDILTRWVKMGLPWSEGGKIAVKHGPPPVDDAARNFWSFRPVQQPPVPAIKHGDWVKNPIDAFVLVRLEAAGLQPAPPAERRVLVRRLYYDLLGLPPTPAELEKVLADQSTDWYEKLIEQLLASPHYGEKWARHWLDVVRYAETNSFERDGAKPFVWRYRDYVIQSFNVDKPYDQFIKEQLAGDELDNPADAAARAERLIATGYYRLGTWDDEPADPTQALYDDLDDIVATTGQTFLGLTVNCGRCHDHKIDPFPQKDYYRLLAFFHGFRRLGVRSDESVAEASLRPIGGPEELARYKDLIDAHKRKLADLGTQLKMIEDSVAGRLKGGERDDFKFEQNRIPILKKNVPALLTREMFDSYRALWQQRDALKKNPPRPATQALCITEIGPKPRDTFVLQRGNPASPGEKVEPGFPSVLTNQEPAPAKPQAATAGRRRVLADWLASPANPLTARVMVNRIWQYHFGRGIVRTGSDFGYRGAPPTHPELLDWLAWRFAHDENWSVKKMHRLILTSNAYRMSSRPDVAALARDPENDLLWRFDVRRLEAEEIRDSILAVCGNLNLKMGGPSIHPAIPKEVLAGQSMPGHGWDQACPPGEQNRRSVYVHVKRSLPLPILNQFDAADPDGPCPVRFCTTPPTQALGMINGAFLNEQAKLFAEDLEKKAGNDPSAQVRLALWRVTQREPTPRDIERSLKFLERMRLEHGQKPAEALKSFCLLALNLNEFVYLD